MIKAAGNKLTLCSCVFLAYSNAAAADPFLCTIKDVLETTPIGTLSRRPTLTQAEMTLHPTFRIDTATGEIRGTQPSLHGQWAKLGAIDPDFGFQTIVFAANEGAGGPPSQFLRIRTAKQTKGVFFLLVSPTSIRSGECEPAE